jgi:hypothetical protein
MARARRACELLTSEVWSHEHAEESDLYPALNRMLGGVDPTAPMSRAHAEIAVQIARLGRLADDIGDREPDDTDVTELRGILYGLPPSCGCTRRRKTRPTCHSATPRTPVVQRPERPARTRADRNFSGLPALSPGARPVSPIRDSSRTEGSAAGPPA